MIIWSDTVRKSEPGYFCQITCAKGNIFCTYSSKAIKMVFLLIAIYKDVWIVSDIRRKTDIEWFWIKYGNKIKTVRIISNDDIRAERGWVYTNGDFFNKNLYFTNG